MNVQSLPDPVPRLSVWFKLDLFTDGLETCSGRDSTLRMNL